MEGRRNIWFLFLPILLGIIPFSARAYEVDTHALLTNEAFDFFNDHSNEGLSEEARAFLIDGARREDDAPRWMNHFYDPVNDRGFSHDSLINPEIDVGDWQKSKEWAEDKGNQNKLTYKVPATVASILSALERWKISEITTKTDFTWQEAIRHYVNGDTEKAFFTLGHILHLIQDTSVPDHTRNDPHPEGSVYEKFAEKYNLSNEDEELKKRLVKISPIALDDLNSYFDELAKYSNNNFYSKDTIGIQTGYSIPQPELTNFDIKNGIFYIKNKDTDGEEYYLIVKKSLGTLFADAKSNVVLDDDFIKESYWSRLSTKSVQYSAGVIDLFFKDVEKAKADPNFERNEEKSLFGKMMDVVLFGIGEVGSVVRNVFTDDESKVEMPNGFSEVVIEEDENGDEEPIENTTEIIEEQNDEETDTTNDISEEGMENEENKEVIKEKDEPIEKKDVVMEENVAPKVCAYNQNKISNNKKIILNEVAWMGTTKGYSKEWFELKNISPDIVSLAGWQVVSVDNEIKVFLPNGVNMAPGSLALFERTGDDVVEEITADGIYSGNLSNDGTKETEGLRVFDASCVVHDEALAVPWWPAGDNKEKRTMERNTDTVGWHTSSIVGGTPRKENSSAYIPVTSGGGTTVSTPRTYRVKINEIMYDAPESDEGKEWIEIKNEDADVVDMSGWKLYESGTDHSLSLVRGGGTLTSGEYAVIADDAAVFLSENPLFSGTLFDSAFALSNNGKTVAIKNGTLVIDTLSYSSSTGAHGDGRSLQKIDDIWRAAPGTPGRVNILPNEPPVVDFSMTPSEPVAGSFVYFDSLSSDPDGMIVDLEWKFGDGMTASGASSSATHMYAQDGFFEVILSAIDDDGALASSSRVLYVASSSATTSPAMHVVISEILFNGSGADTGKEFVELYNPTDAEIDINGWSLEYFVGNATTGIPIATIGISGDGITHIPAKSFFLVGLNNYDPANFNGRTADIVRSRSLPGGTDRISVTLFDHLENEVDRVRYTSESIVNEGQSIERKTVVQNMCTVARGDQEYLGNTCDRGSDGDFESRDTPTPQNSQNLPEPRNKPSSPAAISGVASIGSFTKNTMKISFAWTTATSSDPMGEVRYSISDVSDATRIVEIAYTTSTDAEVAVNEVGRNYQFEIYAEDAEGYQSDKTSFVVFIPSFLSSLYVYPDTRNADGGYLIDMYWEEFPFIAQNKGGNGWQAVVFYKNMDANKNNGMLSANEGYAVPTRNGIIQTQYESCATDTVGGYEDIFIIPLESGRCSSQGGGLFPRAFNWSRLEDNHAIIKTSTLALGDYIAVGYYDMNAFGHFELSAVDMVQWRVQGERPQQHAPELSGNIQTSFSQSESKLTLTLPQKLDRDTIDRDVVYEINFSPQTNSVLDETLWTATTTVGEYIRSVLPNDAFLIGVRARDDFGNVSAVATTTWEYPATQFPISQTNSDDFGISFGFPQSNWQGPIGASFQSIVPEIDISINTVVLKVKQYGFDRSYAGRPRLTFLGSVGTSTPDFSSVLGESRLADLSCRDDSCANEEKVFSFSPALTLHAGETYWLTLDVEYGDPAGYEYHTWRNATQSGGSAYGNGIGGNGYYRGQNAACGETVACSFSPSPNFDWYVKIGKIE